MKKLLLLGFIVLALAQWIIPAKTIWDREKALRQGAAFKFRTEPVDPTHPFKGKYIFLNFKEDVFLTSDNFLAGDEVNVSVIADDSGFAKIQDVALEKPFHPNYFRARISYVSKEEKGIELHLEYPFHEFYMEEFKAPRAETIYRNSSADSTQKTYALVRILKGTAVIQDVFINDIPIRQLIK